MAAQIVQMTHGTNGTNGTNREGKDISKHERHNHLQDIEGSPDQRDLKPGEEITVRIDQTLTQDSTGTMVYLQLEAMNVDRIKRNCPLHISIIIHCRPVLKMPTITPLSKV